MNEQEHPSNDYQHGYESGVQGVNPNTYESYLSSQVNYNWLSQRIQEKRDEIQQINQTIEQTSNDQKTVYNKWQEFVQSVEKATKLLTEHKFQLQVIDNEVDSLKKRRAQTKSEYSLLAGLLFFVAGLSFVFGDLIISHEIVAYALNIKNYNEAWAFAIGLAMISVLLKPAYDRLIEKPYTEEYSEKSRKRYAWFKGFIAIFAIVTLGILGWFRYEAYRTDKLKDAINKAVKNIQLNATPLDPTSTLTPEQQQSVLQKIEQQIQKSDELNLGLVNSPWALASFVLSGILFALAGAVSLGMGLPVLQNFWYRWLQIDPRLARLRRRRKKLIVQLQGEEANVVAETTEKNKLEHELSLLPAIPELKAEKNQLNKEIDELIESTRLAQTDSRIAAYNDGYSKGEISRNMMDNEEYEQYKKSHFTTHNLALKAASSSDKSTQNSPHRSNVLRPHQLVRKMITDQFNGDNNKNE